jgi:hypothetical protein
LLSLATCRSTIESSSLVTARDNIRPGGGLAVAVAIGFLVAKEVIQ